MYYCIALILASCAVATTSGYFYYPTYPGYAAYFQQDPRVGGASVGALQGNTLGGLGGLQGFQGLQGQGVYSGGYSGGQGYYPQQSLYNQQQVWPNNQQYGYTGQQNRYNTGINGISPFGGMGLGVASDPYLLQQQLLRQQLSQQQQQQQYNTPFGNALYTSPFSPYHQQTTTSIIASREQQPQPNQKL